MAKYSYEEVIRESRGLERRLIFRADALERQECLEGVVYISMAIDNEICEVSREKIRRLGI